MARKRRRKKRTVVDQAQEIANEVEPEEAEPIEAEDKKMPLSEEEEAIVYEQYDDSKIDMENRRDRKNGWKAVTDAYMQKLPDNWPFTSRVTDPRVRTSLIEKNGRLLNAKLRGRLVPREGADVITARLNNAILEYQWDDADLGGSMIEKISKCDMNTRGMGASFAYVYWDEQKECNEMKPLDPMDALPDPSGDHVKSCRWFMIREYSTKWELEEQGYDLGDVFDDDAENVGDDLTDRHSYVKENRDLEDRLGDDRENPVVEVVTKYVPHWATEDKKGRMVVFLPGHKKILFSGANPYKHGRIPVAQLRYYSLGDDIYGESEVEPVLPLARAINAFLSGFSDEMNLALRPPTKIKSTGVRIHTIQYGPGARWIMNDMNNVEQARIGDNAIKAFNNIYPALVSAFNTAMGETSLGVSNYTSKSEDKTATEVRKLAQQQTQRDQNNQLYLGEFLKDIMLMWLSNNQQYIFSDPEKKAHVLRIVGKDDIKELQNLGLDKMEVPSEALDEIEQIMLANPTAVSDADLEQVLAETTVPSQSAEDQNGELVPKLKVYENGQEADLYITRDDMKGLYDYVPDVKSMALGANEEMMKARRDAFNASLNSDVRELLKEEGMRLKVSEILTTMLEDAGFRDAESIFESIGGQQEALLPGGGGGLEQVGPAQAAPGGAGVGAGPAAIPYGPGARGLPQPAGQAPVGGAQVPLA